MQFVRFFDGQRAKSGVLEDGAIRPLAGGFYGPLRFAGPTIPADSVRLLAPVRPRKVVCVGLNYRTHAAELGLPVPAEPVIFLKPPTAVIGPGADIVYPRISQRVDYEGELVAVIGRRLRRASPERAEAAILGYTCGNDVTARDLQKKDGQWTRAKSFDTFAPVGPAITPGLDPASLRLITYLNGAPVQRDSTANMIFHPAELVGFISQVMTLEPGDLVFTGTPAGIGPLEPGDTVCVEIGGIGTLRNRVRPSPSPGRGSGLHG